MRTVVLAGMYAPYPGPFDGVEVWGCNLTYKHQPNLSRLYCMDPIPRFKRKVPDFVQDVNALGVPVVCGEPDPEIPLSEPYPLESVSGLIGHPYFTSSIAYMLADAIYKGYERIVLHRLLVLPVSGEYMMQKPCLDFWCGLALGRGIQLSISEDSNLCRPYPWESGLYGYSEGVHEELANQTVTSGVIAALRLPVEFRPAV